MHMEGIMFFGYAIAHPLLLLYPTVLLVIQGSQRSQHNNDIPSAGYHAKIIQQRAPLSERSRRYSFAKDGSSSLTALRATTHSPPSTASNTPSTKVTNEPAEPTTERAATPLIDLTEDLDYPSGNPPSGVPVATSAEGATHGDVSDHASENATAEEPRHYPTRGSKTDFVEDMKKMAIGDLDKVVDEINVENQFVRMFPEVPKSVAEATLANPVLMGRCVEQRSGWKRFADTIFDDLAKEDAVIPDQITKNLSDQDIIWKLKSQFATNWEWFLVGTMHTNLACSDSNKMLKALVKIWCQIGLVMHRLIWGKYPDKPQGEVTWWLTGADWKKKKIDNTNTSFCKLRKMMCIINNFKQMEAVQSLRLTPEAKQEKLSQQKFLNEMQIPTIN